MAATQVKPIAMWLVALALVHPARYSNDVSGWLPVARIATVQMQSGQAETSAGRRRATSTAARRIRADRFIQWILPNRPGRVKPIEHPIDDHSGHGDVEPDRERHAREAPMPIIAPLEAQVKSPEHQRQS